MVNREQAYYAVIFTSTRKQEDQGYDQMAVRMDKLAAQQPGYIGVESVRDEGGNGITVSYWESEEAIQQWKRHAAHQLAQEKGKSMWYEDYYVRICKVEREYGLNKKDRK
ncbi:antibiotic biosynthesis monooxygenase [Mechercharimyces sp. CAU 1602]|uniref:antibiotic biosynthesis monooxygenase family protein n=1 Tax=Mechercharimyces sp. CAU 1602 TaxID=2973933 RepID=UPI0021634F67|nr:antibiotic biosynthesis monooxygenase [Mechercharimyces sp. CAU 1602]MCS1351875.1 antibiotic biosynthesis monooxygenase [Mechercharimyces sp. CAU 1602]